MEQLVAIEVHLKPTSKKLPHEFQLNQAGEIVNDKRAARQLDPFFLNDAILQDKMNKTAVHQGFGRVLIRCSMGLSPKGTCTRVVRYLK